MEANGVEGNTNVKHKVAEKKKLVWICNQNMTNEKDQT